MWKKVLLLVIVVIGILSFVVSHNESQEEEKLNQEIEEIEKLLDASELDEKALEEKINSTVTTGEYYQVEKACKNYLKDAYELANDVTDFYESLNFDNLLTAENIQKDGKDFIQTKALLDSYIKEVDDLKKKSDLLLNEEYVMSYLKENMGDYYVRYFKKIIGDVGQSSDDKKFLSYLSAYSEKIKNIKDLFDFLSKNKDHWNLEEEVLVFDSNELLSEYTKIENKAKSVVVEPIVNPLD